MRHTLIVAAISAILLTGCDSKESNIRIAMECARLGPLPVRHEEVEVATVGNPFARRFYIKFHATPEQINKWIAGSPSLKGKEPITQNAKRKYLSGEEWNIAVENDELGHDFFFIPKEIPWFDPTVLKRGRRFEIEQNHNAEGGTVVIDDENNIVYITASYS